jgi:hypothetical protein
MEGKEVQEKVKQEKNYKKEYTQKELCLMWVGYLFVG